MPNTSTGHSRPKQYYVLRDHKEKDVGDWKKGEIVEVDPEIAIPYVGARILVPLASAIRTKLIPPLDPVAAKAAEEAAKQGGDFTVVVDDAPKQKTLMSNPLKAAVQEKKAEVKPDTKPTESKLATQSETPTKEPVKELTAAEKAIQAKIAALKAKK